MKNIDSNSPGFKFAAVLVALGLGVGGFFIGNGISQSFAKRTVTVKGLAERDVVADMAIWSINISEVGGDLTELQNKVDSSIEQIKSYLTESGFAADDVQNNRVQVRDNFAGWSSVEMQGKEDKRYVIETGVTVRSDNVSLVNSVSRKLGELVKKGITIKEDYTGPIYVFNGLNDIKISMIEQATKNATDAGEQFAKDANAKLGKIQSANQGVFSIESRDPISSWSNDEKQSIDKKVRVVSTVTFRLK